VWRLKPNHRTSLILAIAVDALRDLTENRAGAIVAYGNMDFVGAIGDIRCGHCLPKLFLSLAQFLYRQCKRRRLMVKLKYYYSFFLLCSICLTGCPQKSRGVSACVKSRQASNIKLVLGSPDDIQKPLWVPFKPDHTQVARITSVTFSIKTGGNDINWRGRTIWGINSTSRTGEALSEITYGKTPKGFTASIPEKVYPADEIQVTIRTQKETPLDSDSLYSWSTRLQATE
jgi:hypothetical protein